MQQQYSYACATDGIPSVRFNSLKHEGERLCHLNPSVAFFVPLFHQLVELVQGASARWVYPYDQSVNLHQLRLFSFNSVKGVESKGAIIMAKNPKQHSWDLS